MKRVRSIDFMKTQPVFTYSNAAMMAWRKCCGSIVYTILMTTMIKCADDSVWNTFNMAVFDK